jgi:uncharacterized RDD family membrane protein YckC
MLSDTHNLPIGVELAGLGRRAIALLIDIILFPLLLVVGYVIWWLIVIGRGQTPGKQLTGIRIARADTGETAGWGLSFVRELLIEFLLFEALLNEWPVVLSWRYETQKASLQIAINPAQDYREERPIPDKQLA